MSIIDEINKHQPDWEGETEDGTVKRIFVILGNINSNDEENESIIEDESSE